MPGAPGVLLLSALAVLMADNDDDRSGDPSSWPEQGEAGHGPRATFPAEDRGCGPRNSVTGCRTTCSGAGHHPTRRQRCWTPGHLTGRQRTRRAACDIVRRCRTSQPLIGMESGSWRRLPGRPTRRAVHHDRHTSPASLHHLKPKRIGQCYRGAVDWPPHGRDLVAFDSSSISLRAC